MPPKWFFDVGGLGRSARSRNLQDHLALVTEHQTVTNAVLAAGGTGVGTTSRSQVRTVQLSEWVAVSPRVPEYGGSRFWLPCRRCMTMVSLARGFHNEATRRIAVSPS